MSVDALIAGFKGFRALNYEKVQDGLFAKLAKQGQDPRILLIACSDSRVDPAILFNAAPGELFVVRVVAALVPPYKPNEDYHGVSAALEYAVRDLEVDHIVVLGHAHCGGIQALTAMGQGKQLDREFIGQWVSLAQDATDSIPDDSPPHRHEQATVRHSIRNLKTFPWIEEKVTSGKLQLHAWWFDLDHGHLMTDDNEGSDFVKLV